MKTSILFILFCFTACTAQTNAPVVQNEPVLGGPCEGCELVFSGQPEIIEASARLAPKDEKGEALVVTGMVKTSEGIPVEGIIVYAYQTDAGGIYPKSDNRHGRLRAWVRTDKDGNYRFDTVRPGSYPNTQNAQHIHMHVIEPAKGTYYIDDVVFTDDPLLTPEAKKQMLTGRGGIAEFGLKRDEKGVWHVRRDIVLGAGIPGYK